MERSRVHLSTGRTLGGFATVRSIVLGLSRIIAVSLPAASVSAAPVSYIREISGRQAYSTFEHNDGDDPDSGTSLLVLYVASAILVLLGGAFAGLTIALMGQDSIYLQVLQRDETDPQQKNAKRVYNLLQRGKHWVLVTLLLSNVIVNETLPVVLDRCLGGGVAAVVGSTVLIVIFGEVLPQSICVRYGLQIGGVMSKPVLALMWLMAPVAWPTAKVLDHALGEDHGTVYKKSGLKTLVTLHRSLGEVSERLNQDEVTIISAVLDLKEKPVSSVMTPMDDVFTMSEDTVLDEKMMDLILSAGYSRIPIHEPGNPTNFIGMLLVKILITYDPDDKMRVSEFPLATLPETRPETSCLDIVNFFQEGKSHMVLVSQYPGEDHGALGVVTLEDVIEELIGEEIIDESDVYIDVHKAIRRLQPAPRARPIRHRALAPEYVAAALADGTKTAVEAAEAVEEEGGSSSSPNAMASTGKLSKTEVATLSTSPKTATFMMRRRSAGADGRMTRSTVPIRANIDEMWQHLRHLGPSNPASNPKNTRSTTVKIKTGNAVPRSNLAHGDLSEPAAHEAEHEDDEQNANEDDETTHLLKPTKLSGGNSDTSPLQSYGTHTVISNSSTEIADQSKDGEISTITVDVNSNRRGHASVVLRDEVPGDVGHGNTATTTGSEATGVHQAGSESDGSAANVIVSVSEYGTLTSRRPIVRSGSITENVVETRGIRKVVLETTSSADDDSEAAASGHGERRHHLPSKLHSPAITEDEQVKSDDEAAGEPSSLAGDSHHDAAHHRGDGAGAGGKKKNRRKKRKGNKP